VVEELRWFFIVDILKVGFWFLESFAQYFLTFWSFEIV
jgi:hypothetical protein